MQKIHEFQSLYLFKTTGKWKQVQDLLNLQKENEMIQHNARLEVIATEQRAADIRVQFEEVNLQIAMEELKKIRYQNSKSNAVVVFSPKNSSKMKKSIEYLLFSIFLNY